MFSNSEMSRIEKSQQGRIAEYCRAHSAEFEVEMNDYLRRYFFKSRVTYFVALTVLALGPLNALKTGEWILYFSHVPVALLFVFYHFIGERYDAINKRSVLYLDITNKVMIAETIWTFYIYHASGNIKMLAGSGPLLTMTLMWAMNARINVWTNVVHSSVCTAITLGAIGYWEPEFLVQSLSSWTIGAVLGLMLQSLILKLFRYKFYFGEQEKKLRTHAYRQLEKVLYPHQRQMIEDGATLEETMPVGEGQGCVIAFDIVESSKIKSPYARTLIQNVLKNCQALMMKDYRPDASEASAYRIKEMGDGFLCSVGFPFKVPGMWDKETMAVKLAQQFVQIFHEESKKLAGDEKIYCSIGIASGSIEAFYPHTTPKEYDLYGRPLVLATRYEAVRKELFNHIPKSSIIVLHEAVHLRLAPQMQHGFVAHDLKNMKIRDDQDAQRLYYMVFDYQGRQYARPPNLASSRAS